mgnify:CR=1 FL=1
MWQTFIIEPMTNLLLLIYTLIGQNFGIAIILFTILIRAITWPLTAQQLKGTSGIQELQTDKEWMGIQKKYKNDKEKLAQEQMRIYKERGINPFGSCLPTIIQFPIIIGLYQAIIRALAATPLSLLDLSRGLYSVLDITKVIPLNSTFLWMDLGRPEVSPITIFGFNIPILAIIVVITSYMQSKLMTPPPNPGGNDQSAAMSGMMSVYMPLLMGYFALTFASGLALYFITSNTLGVAQYAMMGKANWSNLIPGRKK